MGSWAAQILHEQGGLVVGVSDVNGAIVNPQVRTVNSNFFLYILFLAYSHLLSEMVH